MIYVGIDDTDVLDQPGTNKNARALVRDLGQQYPCSLIIRHQLLEDPRVPCTSKNSSASLLFPSLDASAVDELAERIAALMRRQFVEGSDPGLCVTATIPEEVVEFGKRCQRELVSQDEARQLARRHGIYLEGLGGTEDGVIGALASVGLAVEGSDGRVVQIGTWPDDLSGPQEVDTLGARGVEVRRLESGEPVAAGAVDVGKHLRPNYRQHKVVLFVQHVMEEPSASNCLRAVRLK